MSLLKEYKELEAIRQAELEKSRAHYLKANVPGNRTMDVDAEAVRKRIAEMSEVKALPNHEKES